MVILGLVNDGGSSYLSKLCRLTPIQVTCALTVGVICHALAADQVINHALAAYQVINQVLAVQCTCIIGNESCTGC